MSQLLGEFECKMDAKGRLIIPAGLRKQLPPDAQDKLIINRGFEKCLVLFPKPEWEKITEEVMKLNRYNRKNREFFRHFFRGATELPVDNASRINVPNSLLEYAGIKGDVVLFAYGNQIELWAKDQYDNIIQHEPDDFASLAEEVMGKISEKGGDHVS